MMGEGRRESDGGRKEGGGMLEGWGARAHSPGLVVAHVCSCVLAIVRRRPSPARSSSFVCIHFCLWACVVVRGHSFLLVGMHLGDIATWQRTMSVVVRCPANFMVGFVLSVTLHMLSHILFN